VTAGESVMLLTTMPSGTSKALRSIPADARPGPQGLARAGAGGVAAVEGGAAKVEDDAGCLAPYSSTSA
jgi:hypothetical protein